MYTEKITINLGAVDLGQIDLLVEQGFYSNRSDFIRTATRNQISKHTDQVKIILTSQYFVGNDKTFITGVGKLTRKELEQLKSTNIKLKMTVIGVLIIDKEITPKLARETIQYLKVYGMLRASQEIKEIILEKSKSSNL